MVTVELTIAIPAEVKSALKIPEKERGARLRLELAVHLYEEWLLSFGKSAKLAQVSRWEFAEELTKRGIDRHYSEKDLEDDMAFANLAGKGNGR